MSLVIILVIWTLQQFCVFSGEISCFCSFFVLLHSLSFDYTPIDQYNFQVIIHYYIFSYCKTVFPLRKGLKVEKLETTLLNFMPFLYFFKIRTKVYATSSYFLCKTVRDFLCLNISKWSYKSIVQLYCPFREWN